MSNPVAYVSSLADRCGVRPATGISPAASLLAPSPNGGLYGQLKLSAIAHGSKVAYSCMNRTLITHTYTDLLDHANKIGAMLTSMKVPERSVCLFLSRPTFPLIASYIGTVAANCVPSILHDDVADADLVHIANDCRAAVVFVASQPVSDKSPQQLPDKFIQSILPKLTHCKHVVLLPPDSLSDAGVLQKLQAEAHLLSSKFNSKSVAPGEERRSCSFGSWSDGMAAGLAAHQTALESRASNIHIDSCCCVCYGSSASRARPVGSMLSHDNVLWTARLFAENYLHLQSGDIVAATLPMAFALSQVVYIAASIQAGATVCFPRAQSKPYDVLVSFFVEVQPHVVLCTPLQLASLVAEIEKLPTTSQASVSSKDLGLLGGRAAALGQPKPRFYGWNRTRVFSKIWAVSGLARCKFLGSYGDVCSQNLTERFMALGMCLCNVYGCNESTGIIAATRNDPMRPQLPLANEWKFGRVGRCIPGCQLRVDAELQAPGKLMFTGRNSFMGYLNRDTISTADGFVDTGDWGSSDESFADVVGRNCDRIVLSTGASLHAASIQAAIEQGLPGTARAILIGHGLPHLSVMCEFTQDTAKGSLSHACISWQREKFSDPAAVQVTTAGALASDNFMRQVAVALHEMQAAGKFKGASVAKVTFIQDRLSVEEEDLIPGGRFTCRRDHILKRYIKQICKMYANVPLATIESSLNSVYLDTRATSPDAANSSSQNIHEHVSAPNVARQSSSIPDKPGPVFDDKPVSLPAPSSHSVSPDASIAREAHSSAAAASNIHIEDTRGASGSAPAAGPPEPSQPVISKPPSQQPLHASHLISDRDSFSAPPPPGSISELPDGTKVDLSEIERRLEEAAPILARAVVYHLPGQTYFVSMLSLRTQAWQSVSSDSGAAVTGALPHHLLHEDVVAAISARGSSAMTTMEAKNDKVVRAMLTDALKKVNESAPRDANGKKQATVLKYVVVPTGLGLADDEKLPDGCLNRARIIEKFKSSVNQMYSVSSAPSAPAIAASISPGAASHPKQSDIATSPSEQGVTALLQSTAGVDGESHRPNDPEVSDAAASSGGAAAPAAQLPPRAVDPVVSSASADASSSKPVGVQCGVGVYLKLAQEGFIEVKATEPGCSADGLLFVGDIVTAVDGNSCVGLSLRDITRLIVGEEGSCVTISVMREFAVSPISTRTMMREVPVLLTRRPLPQQRSARAVKELSESSLQTPRGDVRQQATVRSHDANDTQPASHSSRSLPATSSALGDSDVSNQAVSAHATKEDAPMRQFFVSNVGSLPLKLTVFDCDDVLRVSELVLPLSQYPLEQNTYLPLPTGQRVRIVLQSGMNEFYLQLGAYDRFQHCFLCAAADATGIQTKPLFDISGREIQGNLNARQLHANSATTS